MSGEEIIGDTVATDDQTTVKIESAASIMMVPSQSSPGQVGLALVPFMPYNDSSYVTISRNFIAVEVLPSTDMVNNYNRQFGSGIQIASSLG